MHPYIIQRGLAAGFLEEVIDIFGADDLFPRAILMGRFGFWGWAGAYLYSFHLTWRRFLAYDLTPSVYIFTGNRFFLAVAVGGVVGLGVGTFSTAAGVPFDVNMATVAIVLFFIGFFPDQGLNWVAATAKKALGQRGGIAKETRLSEVEGLSIWHQGRLKQESIENVQNLATADVPGLVVGTPFTVNQIVDWVDQAGLKKSELRVLSRVLQSALNIKMVSRFRWQSSMDVAKVEEAAAIQLLQPSPAPGTMQLPREQEEMMFEGE
jgi:hypothetical protein